MPRVLITPSYLRHGASPFRNILQFAGFEPVYPRPRVSLANPESLIEQLEDIDAVIAGTEVYSAEVIKASSLRVIARCGVDCDAIDVAAATKRKIAVTNAPSAHKESAAELTLALIVGTSHGFPGRDHEARSGKWKQEPLPRLSGQTLGLIGMGAVAKTLMPMVTGLGLRVIAHDSQPNEAYGARRGVQFVSLDELLAQADIISLHLPLTEETTKLINADAIAKMKPGAILINTASGGLVDEKALIKALQSGHLASAGLDVFQSEPLSSRSTLAKLENVLLSPHMGGLDNNSITQMARLAADSVVQMRDGRWPEGRVVNAQLRQNWEWSPT